MSSEADVSERFLAIPVRGAPAPAAGWRRLLSLTASLALAGVLAACAVPGPIPGTPAIGSAPIGAPTIRVGDRWVYRGSDGEAPDSISLERTVSRIDGDRIEMRQQMLDSSGRAEPGVRVRSMSRSTLAPDIAGKVSGQIRYADFPLALGKSWEYRYQLAAGANSLSSYRVAARVEGIERVRVPAGVFDAVRIEHQGDWSTPVADAGAVSTITGRIVGTFWYAPAINGWARIDLTLYRPDGSVETRLQQELVRYEPAQR